MNIQSAIEVVRISLLLRGGIAVARQPLPKNK
jgi:hypothetical protein